MNPDGPCEKSSGKKYCSFSYQNGRGQKPLKIVPLAIQNEQWSKISLDCSSSYTNEQRPKIYQDCPFNYETEQRCNNLPRLFLQLYLFSIQNENKLLLRRQVPTYIHNPGHHKILYFFLFEFLLFRLQVHKQCKVLGEVCCRIIFSFSYLLHNGLSLSKSCHITFNFFKCVHHLNIVCTVQALNH